MLTIVGSSSSTVGTSHRKDDNESQFGGGDGGVVVADIVDLLDTFVGNSGNKDDSDNNNNSSINPDDNQRFGTIANYAEFGGLVDGSRAGSNGEQHFLGSCIGLHNHDIIEKDDEDEEEDKADVDAGDDEEAAARGWYGQEGGSTTDEMIGVYDWYFHYQHIYWSFSMIPLMMQSCFGGILYGVKSLLLGHVVGWLLHQYSASAVVAVQSTNDANDNSGNRSLRSNQKSLSSQPAYATSGHLQSFVLPLFCVVVGCTTTRTNGACSAASVGGGVPVASLSTSVLDHATSRSLGISSSSSSWPPPAFMLLATLTTVAFIVHPDGLTWWILRQLRDGMVFLLRSLTTFWTMIVNEHGAIISTILALSTFASLFFLVYVMHKTLSPKKNPNAGVPGKRKQQPSIADGKHRQHHRRGRRGRRHGGHGSGRNHHQRGRIRQQSLQQRSIPLKDPMMTTTVEPSTASEVLQGPPPSSSSPHSSSEASETALEKGNEEHGFPVGFQRRDDEPHADQHLRQTKEAQSQQIQQPLPALLEDRPISPLLSVALGLAADAGQTSKQNDLREDEDHCSLDYVLSCSTSGSTVDSIGTMSDDLSLGSLPCNVARPSSPPPTLIGSVMTTSNRTPDTVATKVRSREVVNSTIATPETPSLATPVRDEVASVTASVARDNQQHQAETRSNPRQRRRGGNSGKNAKSGGSRNKHRRGRRGASGGTNSALATASSPESRSDTSTTASASRLDGCELSCAGDAGGGAAAKMTLMTSTECERNICEQSRSGPPTTTKSLSPPGDANREVDQSETMMRMNTEVMGPSPVILENLTPSPMMTTAASQTTYTINDDDFLSRVFLKPSAIPIHTPSTLSLDLPQCPGAAMNQSMASSLNAVYGWNCSYSAVGGADHQTRTDLGSGAAALPSSIMRSSDCTVSQPIHSRDPFAGRFVGHGLADGVLHAVTNEASSSYGNNDRSVTKDGLSLKSPPGLEVSRSDRMESPRLSFLAAPSPENPAIFSDLKPDARPFYHNPMNERAQASSLNGRGGGCSVDGSSPMATSFGGFFELLPSPREDDAVVGIPSGGDKRSCSVDPFFPISTKIPTIDTEKLYGYDDEAEIEAELQELGGRVVGSILD